MNEVQVKFDGNWRDVAQPGFYIRLRELIREFGGEPGVVSIKRSDA